jgi:hypothetical protein
LELNITIKKQEGFFMQKWWGMLLAVVMVFSIMSIDTPTAEASTASQVISEGKKVQGTPYQWGGRTPSTGFDCSGFVRYAYGQAGISLPLGTANQVREGTFVSRSNLQPGDIVFFSGTYRSGVSHNGIYIGNNQFINATVSQGVTITSMNNSYWSPKYHSARRIISGGSQESVASTSDSSSADKAVITANTAAIVRDRGFRTANRIGSIPRGKTVDVIQEYNYYSVVSDGSTRGFVSKSLLDTSGSSSSSSSSSSSVSSSGNTAVVTANTAANVRDRGFRTANRIGSISRGTTVEVIQTYNYYAVVTDGSTRGFVSLSLLDMQ